MRLFAATRGSPSSRHGSVCASPAVAAPSARVHFWPAPPSFDHEKATLERVRRFNRRRNVYLALAWGFALTLLAFSFEGRQVRWVMLRDSQWQAVIFMVAAFVCLASYLRMGRRLQDGR